MNLKDFVLEAHDHAVRYQTTRVESDGAKAPMRFVVVANRGSQHVATFFPRNRDEMLWTMRIAVGGFGCDLVAGSTASCRSALAMACRVGAQSPGRTS